MSTKSSIKWNKAHDRPGYHLYSDVMDEGDDPPVYLELNGVGAELYTMEGGACVTLTIPARIARELGLLLPNVPSAASNESKEKT